MSTDDEDAKALRERVRELEQTADDLRETVAELQQRRGPTRRDLLKVGSGGLLGAGLLASSQPVSAAPASADTSAGQVGVAGNSTDVVLDQLRDPGGDEILNVDDTGGVNAQFGRTWYFDSVNTERLTDDYHYAGAYDGADADARLDNALSTASGEDVIFLEQASYSTNRTISTRINLRGDFSATEIQDATWTLDASQTSLFGTQLRGTAEIVVDQPRVHLDRVYDLGNGITINGNDAIVTRCFAAAITFASGTEDGVADTNTSATITDNGTNVVGDNS